MKILAVDDSAIIRNAVAVLGYEFFEAANGREALSILMRESIDVLTMDWNMPVLDGYDTVCEIRKNPAFENIQILMLTSRGGESCRHAALRAGANDYMTKPFNQEDLMSRLMDLMTAAVC